MVLIALAYAGGRRGKVENVDFVKNALIPIDFEGWRIAAAIAGRREDHGGRLAKLAHFARIAAAVILYAFCGLAYKTP